MSEKSVAAIAFTIFLFSFFLTPFANAETSGGSSKPTLIWWTAVGDTVGSSPTIANGVLYIGTYNGTVYAIDAQNGKLIWSSIPGPGDDSTPVVANGVVYISSIGSGTVYALDAKTGVVVWSKQIMPSYLTAPTVVNGVVYVGTFNFGGIFALSASTGALLWNSTALDSDWGVPEWIAPHSGVDSPPTVVKGVVYFGSEDGLTYAFDASSRRMLWSINSTDGSVYSSPVVTGGVVYVTVCDFAGPRNEGSGLVYAIDASTGALIWNVTVAPLQNEYPVVVGGVVYVSGYDGNIYALNAANGHQVWSYTAGNYVEYKSYVGEFALSTPNVVNGVVYLNSMDENVYALNAAHGYLLWSYTVGGGIDSAPAVTDGIVYLGSENGNVYALSLSASTSTPTSPTTTPLSTQEPLTAGLVALSGTVAAVLVAAGLLAYFKKRKGETPNLKQ